MTLSRARRARILLSLCGAGIVSGCSDATSAPVEELRLAPEAVAAWTASSTDVRSRVLPHLSRRHAALQLEATFAALTTAINARDESAIRQQIDAGRQVLNAYDEAADAPELSAAARVLDVATLLIGGALPPSPF